MAYSIRDNYTHFKKDFKSDTGLDADEKKELYIQYYNARCSDNSAQLLSALLNEMVNLRREISKDQLDRSQQIGKWHNEWKEKNKK